MYYQNYEDYMRQVLGYPITDPNIYESYDYRNVQNYEDTYFSKNQPICNLSDDEIQSCYPEVYNLVYPMVCKVCDANSQPITRDLIEKMTDEVYFAIEDTNTVVNIRVDTPKVEDNKTPKPRETRTPKPVNLPKGNLKPSATENREVQKTTVKENRQYNSNLRDLIKILLLFRLFGNRPGRPRPPRPPFPGGPGRPPFPGGRPPMGPGGSGRPPIIQPRDYTDYLDF